MLLNDYPQLIFTTQEGNCFMPTQAEKECRRITSIMNNHEKQQALTENREYHISNIHPHLFRHTFITGYMHNYSFRSNATIDQDLQIWSKEGQISIPQTLKPL